MGRRPRRRSQHFAPVATAPTPSVHHVSDWANLPNDLLRLIARATKSTRDMHCIRGVCDSWRESPMLEDYVADPRRQLPWLIVAEDPEGEKRRFFDVTCFRSLPLPAPLLPNPVRRVHGSTRGLLVVGDSNDDLHMVNPLTMEAVALPPLDPPTIKFVLSPAGILVAIHGVRGELAFTRPGQDHEWLALPNDDDVNTTTTTATATTAATNLRPLMCFFTDVVYHEGSFIAINGDGVVIGVELGDDATAIFRRIGKEKVGEERMEEEKKRRRRRQRWPYLASAGEDLCVVMRYMKVKRSGLCRTVDFDVYFYDSGEEEWEHFPGCLDHTLFIGLGESLAVPAAATGWTPNCIYFSDAGLSPRTGEGDMGTYYFQDGYLEPHFFRHGASGIWHLPSFT